MGPIQLVFYNLAYVGLFKLHNYVLYANDLTVGGGVAVGSTLYLGGSITQFLAGGSRLLRCRCYLFNVSLFRNVDSVACFVTERKKFATY